MKSIRIPITNLYAEGGYCARFLIGSDATPVNLILDTGSSTFVVSHKIITITSELAFEGTTYVQDIQYGKGGWYGPVVHTHVGVKELDEHIDLAGVALAITSKEEAASFLNADGIMGLAYTALNHAYDITSYLTENKVDPCVSYPYLMTNCSEDVPEYTHFLHQYPRIDLIPYFSQLEESGVVADQFALLTHRSSIYHTGESNTDELAHTHHLKHGLFVLGAPLKHDDLYQEPILTVGVSHDKYYNVNVLSIQVGESAEIPAPTLAEKHVKAYCTNGIVDSGATALVMPGELLQQVKTQLINHNAAFEKLLSPYNAFTGTEVGIPLSALDLDQWPDITLYLEGERKQPVAVTLTPDTYWQVHSPQSDQATFKLCSLPGWPNQLILGLPLLNNYYTIFDRSEGNTGVIRFAKKVDVPELVTSAIADAIQR
ncbi:pepsin-like aspartic protease [Alteromonas sp. ASW11-130]|uniref:pepsin-like aspartic protease n=1 Tax=Alteromonas sp. ASW11-130 TaxID=3015775 RepID=UPI0022427D73|nr:pepsin-like aspartic protease [Alteromonas sp. ASW11-130]MCW8091463.1 A1 family peptidase [Alteromonas sp. ASW11-130]